MRRHLEGEVVAVLVRLHWKTDVMSHRSGQWQDTAEDLKVGVHDVVLIVHVELYNIVWVKD